MADLPRLPVGPVGPGRAGPELGDRQAVAAGPASPYPMDVPTRLDLPSGAAPPHVGSQTSSSATSISTDNELRFASPFRARARGLAR